MRDELEALLRQLLDLTGASPKEPRNCPPNWWEGYCAGAAMAHAHAAKKIAAIIKAGPATEEPEHE